MKIFAFPAILLMVVSLSGCSSTITPACVDLTGGTSSKTVTVNITSSGSFDPNCITINNGDTVSFVNLDSNPHQPASNPHPVHTDYCQTSPVTTCPGFDSGAGLAQGQSYNFTFAKVGTFGYHDHLHPAVGGSVTVK